MSASVDFIKPGNAVFARQSVRVSEFQLATVVAITDSENGQKDAVVVKWFSTGTTTILPLDDQLFQRMEVKRSRKMAVVVNIEADKPSTSRIASVDSAKSKKRSIRSSSHQSCRRKGEKTGSRKIKRVVSTKSRSSSSSAGVADEEHGAHCFDAGDEPVYWEAQPTVAKLVSSQRMLSGHSDKTALASLQSRGLELPKAKAREKIEEAFASSASVVAAVTVSAAEALPSEQSSSAEGLPEPEGKKIEFHPVLQAPVLSSMGFMVASRMRNIQRIPEISVALMNRKERPEAKLTTATTAAAAALSAHVEYFEMTDNLRNLRKIISHIKERTKSSSSSSSKPLQGTTTTTTTKSKRVNKNKQETKKQKKRRFVPIPNAPPLSAMGCLTACNISDLSMIDRINSLADKKPIALQDKRFSSAYSDWSGNSDDEGSVDDPLLEEEICYECGAEVSEIEWSSMVLCDECNDSFHLACVNLSCCPDGSEPYYCPRCCSDREFFAKMNYTVDEQLEEEMKAAIAATDSKLAVASRMMGAQAQRKHVKIGGSSSSNGSSSSSSCSSSTTAADVHGDNDDDNSFQGEELGGAEEERGMQQLQQQPNYCFSPSRPLELAWLEFQKKGFMLVSRVFDYDIMRQLTHGVFEKKSFAGRVTDSWRGALAEMKKRIGHDSHTLVDRGGRFDMRIPDFVVSQLKLADILAPISSRLRTVMNIPSAAQLRTHDVMYVPTGTKDQKWHVDDKPILNGRSQRYFTILVHLNRVDDLCGGTEVWSDALDRGDLIRGRPGDAFVFAGSMQHRGLGNGGFGNRLFYYASFSTTADANIEGRE